MSDTETAEVSGTQQPETPVEGQSSQPELTPEAITQAFKEKNTEAIENARKMLFESQSSEDASQPAPAPEQSVPETPVAAAEQPKRFAVNYHGEVVEVDDEDGLLGYRNVKQLKQGKIHADLYIKNVEKREAEARALAAAREQELADLRRKYEEAQKITGTQSTQSGQATPATPAATPAPAQRPQPPVYPEIPDDPTDWSVEDAKKFKAYQTGMAQYSNSLADYLANNTNVPEERIAQIVAERTAGMQAQLEQANARLAKVDQAEAEVAAKAAEQKYWDRFASFQAQHKEFNTPLPIRDTHQKVMDWMDRVAEAHGHRRPYDTTSAEFSQYTATRDTLAARYLKGDEAVRQQAQGLEPPAGHQEYFKLADQVIRLDALKKQYVASGQLADNATLHQVYLLHLDETGQLDRDINDLRATERTKGIEDVSKAIQDKATFAKTIPNSLAHQEMTPDKISEEDKAWFVSINGPQLRQLDAESKQKYHSIARALGIIQ